MAVVLKKMWQGYELLFEEYADPRTRHWLFVAKPYQCLILLGLYLAWVLKWGPKWMKHRQPFNLDKVLIVYNALQVVSCFYLFERAISEAWGWNYKWLCEPVDFSDSPRAIEIAKLVYIYFLLKIVDLFDTIFFVLRKKNNQVSFLHIYHHTGMVLLIWGAVTYFPGGHGTLVGVINSFVHVVMYTYYLLSVAMPSIKEAIWLKKFVTQLQILQFLLCSIHMGLIVLEPDCAYPRWLSALFLPQNLFMLVLFVDFYIKTYIKKPKEIFKKAEKNNGTNENSTDRKISNEVYKNERRTDLNETNYKSILNENVCNNKSNSNNTNEVGRYTAESHNMVRATVIGHNSVKCDKSE